MTKKELRAYFIQKRKALSLNRVIEANKHIDSALLSLLKPYIHILSFTSLLHEIDLSSTNTFILQKKQLYLPKVTAEGLKIFHIHDLKTDLEVGSFNVLEPKPSCQETIIKKIECILVPGVCFDAKGFRIGYGFGYYDRLLKHAAHARKIGVSFKEQLCSEIPIEPHDVAVDQVILG